MLGGKAIVITGAGQGLGKAYATRAAAAGASVLVNDINVEQAHAVATAIKAEGGQATAVAGSIADWETAHGLIDTCVERFGAIDGLVNNAALHYLAYPWDEEEAALRRLVEVNVLGSIFCGAHALKTMIAQRSGSIINITSGAHLGMALRSSYGATKGAIASLTYGWALEAEAYGVRVNAVSPTADTPMTRDSSEQEARFPSSTHLSGSAPGPECVAPMVTYLLSDASSGISGQIIRMTGRTINLVSHPENQAPILPSESWTEASIADAFDKELRARLRPIGHAAQVYAWNAPA